jgi:DNA mismatch endonuclease, patch repair protein
MADRITADVRSRNMAAIRGKDTNPEMVVRRFLHVHGFRYRLHDRKLPGRPDVVLPKHHTVVEVRGCFWHMHGCKNTVIPKTRPEWWQEKLEGNRARDERNRLELEDLGWRVIIVWECEISQAHLEDLLRGILQRP